MTLAVCRRGNFDSESLEVQKNKARYTYLRDKKQLSDDESTEFAELADFLSAVPKGGRSNLVVQEEQAQLLRDIQKELRERRSSTMA